MAKPTPEQVIAAIRDLPNTDSVELAQELGCTPAELEAAMLDCDSEELDAAYATWEE